MGGLGLPVKIASGEAEHVPLANVGDIIDCEMDGESRLKTPGADPYRVATYRGTLRPITKEESRALDELMKKQGLEIKAGLLR